MRTIMMMVWVLCCLSLSAATKGESLLPPPTNDNPCGAQLLTVNSACVYTQYTTVQATNSSGPGVPAPSCANYLGGDVWFQVIVPANGIVIIDTDDNVITDGGMAAYTGTCGSLTQLSCNDDSSPSNILMPYLNLTGLTPGSTLFIRFWEYGNDVSGTFSICATSPPPPPSNDEPCSAIALNVGTSCSYAQYTNQSATGTIGVAAPTCAGYSGGDVWFSAVVPANGSLILDSNTGVMLDGGMAVYTGTCSALTQIACNDNASANGAMPLISLTGLTPSSTIYIRFWEDGNNNNGTFSICAFSPLPPANDLICNATPITCGSTTAGSTLGASSTVGAEPANCTVAQTSGGVWYRVVGNGQMYNASLCGTTWNSKIMIFSGSDCNSVTCVGGNNDDGPLCDGNSASYSWLATSGTTYWIMVSGNTTESAFSLSLTCSNVNTGCSGTFTDSGGTGGTYGNNQNLVYMYCPSSPGQRIRMNFTQFDTESTLDELSIYNGSSTSSPILGFFSGTTSPGQVQATVSNPSGCLTFVFDSDGSVTYNGWQASVSCISPCQTINAVLNSTSPTPSGDGIIRVCPNQTISFTGSGTFSNTGTGATYTWSFGDGTTAVGTTVTKSYTTAGAYSVNLTITDPDGCQNSNVFNQFVYVATTPTIATTATPATICPSQTSALTATVTPVTYTKNCTPPVSGTTFLPDGSGASYSTGISVNCYSSNQTVTSATDIQNICLNMEHSYIGDLEISIVCPNGQSTVLKAYPGGSTAFLGCPIDNETNLAAGTGRTYCFTPTATTLLVNGTTSACGTPSGASIVAGDYQSQQTLTNLVGCPLNGTWTIVVEDNIAADNGYIFNWDINFNPAIVTQTPPISFTPSITSQGWVSAANLSQVNSTTANVSPTTPGSNCYTYSVTDNFGCTFTSPQCVTVSTPPTASVSAPASVCQGSPATLTITATPNTTVNLTVAGSAVTVAVGPTGTATYTTAALFSNPTVVTLNSVNVTGNTGCFTTYNTSSNITVNPLVIPSFAVVGPLCYNSGTVTLATTSGNGIVGTWSPASVNTLTPGTQTYTFTPNAGQCAQGTTMVVTVLPPITISIASTSPSCPASCNGTASVTVNGGAAPYTYVWSGPSAASGANPTNLCVGIYTVTVTDANGCQSRPTTPTPTSCFEITSVLVDACGTPENVGEMVFFQVGPTPLTTANLVATWPNNSWNGICTNPTWLANVNASITGGGQVLAAPATLPAGANVVLVSGNTATTSANLFTNLSSTLYVIFQCSQVTTAGHFANASSASGVRTLTMSLGAGCTDVVSYNIQNLIGGDGASVVYAANGTPTYITTGCSAPIPPTSNSITLTSIGGDVQVTASPATICAGGSSTLTATGATNYTWSPSTGLSATTGAVVTATPAVTTTYSILGQTGSCAETEFVTVTVNPAQTASISYSPNAWCANVSASQSVTLTGATGGVYTASPSGLSINSTTGAITPNTSTAGTYTVTYSIAASAGCPAITATATVTINAIPTITASSLVGTACSGPTLASASFPSITLTPTPSSATWSWTGSNGSSGTGALSNPIPNATCSPIVTTYTVTPTNSGCVGTPITITVTTNPKPTSDFTISPSPLCQNSTATVTYTGNSCGTATYNWTWPAGITAVGSGAGPYTISAASAASYVIRLQVVNTGTPGGCTATQVSVPLTVLAAPTASISGTTTICAGNSANITFTGTANAVVTYTVNGGANQTITLNGSGTATLNAGAPTATRTYALVSVTSSGSPSCTTPLSGTAVITVNPLPVATVSGTTTICSGTALNLTISSTPSGATFSYFQSSTGVSGATGGATATITNTLTATTSSPGTTTYTIVPTIGTCAGDFLVVPVTVNPQVSAGTNGTLNLCATGSNVNLFSSLGGTPATTGTWTGPSALGGGNLGTFTLGVSLAGVYTYTVNGISPCPNSSATVTVTVGSGPSSTISYNGPFCTSVTSGQLPTLTGSTGGTYTASPSGLTITSGGAITPSSSTPGSYTITYTIPASGGCSAFVTTTSVVITQSPTVPTLAPPNPCANQNVTFTAGNGTSYEFFVNGVSQGVSSATSTFSTSGLTAGSQVCVRNTPPVPFVMNGLINETAWGSPLATSSGGPAGSGFGAGNNIDALYIKNMKGMLYGALAGNERDGNDQTNNNWICLFIDSKPGGFNNLAAWTNRTNVPSLGVGVLNLFNLALSQNVVFDPGFNADYVLTMNQASATAFFDLYDLVANTNTFLGTNVANPTQFGFVGNTGTGDFTRGFEFSFPLTLVGNPTTQMSFFAMMINDPNPGVQTFISNQFLTRANSSETNYGNGFVDFGQAAPNPINYLLSADCFQETCVTVQPSSAPVFTPNSTTICYGGAVSLPSTSSNGLSGTWSPTTPSNTATGTYTFTPSGTCVTTGTYTVNVWPQIVTVGILHN